jgi:hypothetical protein
VTFDLPGFRVDDFAIIADWVEFCEFFGKRAGTSTDDVADVIVDSGLLGVEPSDLPADDVDYLDEDTFSSDDAAERFVEDVWGQLQRRSTLLGKSYPFKVKPGWIERTVDSWRDAPGVAMLLAVDLGLSYAKSGVELRAHTKGARLFEKIVEAAQSNLFGGTTVRFGWPVDGDWPTPINDRVEELADRLNLDLEDLTGKTRPKDKDIGLDVITSIGLVDEPPATLYFLTQCAVGKHWKSKLGEPTLTRWTDVLKWNSHLVRAIAVPWRLRDEFDYARTFRHFGGAIVFDRLRLMKGKPDSQLSDDTKRRIRVWCSRIVGKFPKL